MSLAAAYWLAFKEPPWLSYPNPELRTLATVVVAGGVLPVRAIRNSSDTRKRSYTTARTLHCDSLSAPLLLDGKVVDVEPGLTSVVSYHMIPDQIPGEEYGPMLPMPTGICYIDGISDINGTIRTSQVAWHTTKFKVLSKADAIKQGLTP